jgi:hypothetical protein
MSSATECTSIDGLGFSSGSSLWWPAALELVHHREVGWFAGTFQHCVDSPDTDREDALPAPSESQLSIEKGRAPNAAAATGDSPTTVGEDVASGKAECTAAEASDGAEDAEATEGIAPEKLETAVRSPMELEGERVDAL